MNWEAFGLLVYFIYLPFLLFLISLSIKSYNHFFVEKRLLSTLAETKSPTYELVSFLIALFCILRLNFTYSLSHVLKKGIFSLFGFFFLFGGTLLGIFIAFYPRDKFKKIHGFFGTALFAGNIGSLLFLIPVIFQSTRIPNFILLINILIIIFTVLMLVADYKSTQPKNGLLLQYRSYWQWLTLGLLLVWDFLMTLFLLRGIYY